MSSTKATAPRENLLLLPATPWPITYDSIKAAYETPIRHTLRHLKSTIKQDEKAINLTIAVHVPFVYTNRAKPRQKLYASVQGLVAGVYTLVCLIAAQDKISLEGEGGIDACVVIIAWPRSRSERPQSLPQESGLDFIGPVVSLPTFAQCNPLLDNLFEVKEKENESLQDYQDYLQDYRFSQRVLPHHVVEVKGGIVRVSAGERMIFDEVRSTGEDVGSVAFDNSKGAPGLKVRDYYYSIAVGGTFDHLHIGHKLLLTMLPFLLGPEPPESAKPIEHTDAQNKQLIIGITGDELLKKKSHQNLIESWPERQKAVWSFLQRIMRFDPNTPLLPPKSKSATPGPDGVYDVTETLGPLTLNFAEIRDPFGPTITNESITALVVSAETRKGGHAVTMERVKKGWRALDVYEVDVLSAEEAVEGEVDEEFKNKLSSTSIRQALADQETSKDETATSKKAGGGAKTQAESEARDSETDATGTKGTSKREGPSVATRSQDNAVGAKKAKLS